jgi:hypothetical protein
MDIATPPMASPSMHGREVLTFCWDGVMISLLPWFGINHHHLAGFEGGDSKFLFAQNADVPSGCWPD